MVVLLLKAIWYIGITLAAILLYRWVRQKGSKYMSRFDSEFDAIANDEDRFEVNLFIDWDTDVDWTDYTPGKARAKRKSSRYVPPESLPH